MNRWLLIILLAFSAGRCLADSDSPPSDNGDQRDETSSDQEWESKGVIPHGGLTVSTQPITPITVLPDRVPAEQGVEETALALDLLKKENTEAASDVALQAYDDLMSVHMPRGKRNKKKRQKLREDRHQAAVVYADASIAYIQEYVRKNGSSRRAMDEGRARLGDLRDVTQSYPELTKKVTKALEAYGVQPAVIPSTSTVVPTPSTTTVSTPTVKS